MSRIHTLRASIWRGSYTNIRTLRGSARHRVYRIGSFAALLQRSSAQRC
ncbi:hypothetical protein CPL00221_CDS0055 [Escherichia phage RobRod40]